MSAQETSIRCLSDDLLMATFGLNGKAAERIVAKANNTGDVACDAPGCDVRTCISVDIVAGKLCVEAAEGNRELERLKDNCPYNLLIKPT